MIPRSSLRGVFILALAFNWIWENAHAVLYTHTLGAVMTQTMLWWATMLDALYITAVALLFIESDFLKKRLWLVVLFGTIVAIGVEWFALSQGWWGYASKMPIVPLVKTGLTPTIQLGLLSYLGLTRLGFKKPQSQQALKGLANFPDFAS